MIRPALFAFVLFAASPVAAQQPSLYEVALASPVAAGLIVKDVKWSCAGAACTAARTGSSPDGNICAAVVRKLGPVTAFVAGGRRFDEAQIARCNAVAK